MTKQLLKEARANNFGKAKPVKEVVPKMTKTAVLLEAKERLLDTAPSKREQKLIDFHLQRAAADKWLAMILKSYVLKAAGESYNGQRWEPRAPGKTDDGHLLLIKTGTLYNAVKNSTVTLHRGKKGEWVFHAEVENKPYPQRGKRKPVMTKDVFQIHQYGTEKCPARPIFVKLSPEDQKELDDFVKTFLETAQQQE